MRARMAITMVVLAAAASANAATPAGCDLSVLGETHPLSSREEALSRYEQLPPSCLKEMVLACNDAANTSLLDLGSAASCSIGYEALLKRGFGGNFHALMAWWRSERTSAKVPD